MAISADLQKEYRRAVERVNKQLYRLEKASTREGYTGILDYAYRNAMRDIQAMGGGKRFSKSVPQTMREYRKRMNAIRRFEEKPTSKLTGVKSIYEKRAGTFSRKAGADINWEGMAKIFESGLWESLVSRFESKTAQKIIGRIQKDREKLKEQMARGEVIQFNRHSVYGRMLNEELGGPGGLTEMLSRYLNGTE